MMRFSIKTSALVLLLVFVVASAGAALAMMRGTTGRRLVARQGDTILVPSTMTRCVVTAEGGVPSLLCSRVSQHRYDVVFFRHNLFVYKQGAPDTPVFSAHGRP